MPLSEEKWNEVYHHFVSAIEISQGAGCDEDEIRQEFENALENTLITFEDNQDYKPKQKKPSHEQSGS
jgi:hypothetical protein